jgi:uncharacterized protein
MVNTTTYTRFFCVIVLLCLISYRTPAQDTQSILTNERLTLHSNVLKEDREILVRLPDGYVRTQNTYPVVYMLDGHTPRINLMTGTIQNLVQSDQAPEMILVSIPNTDRQRDMTPSVIAGQAGGGGADNFLKFIETELIPAIEKKYRVQPYRILVGHSLSGLFATYAFLSRPQVFNAYLAASPHLQWDNHYINRNGATLLQAHKDAKRTLFVALGDEPPYLQGFNGLRDLLDKSGKKYDHTFTHLPEENHSSINADVFHKGLRRVWHKLNIPATRLQAGISLRDIEQHYKDASDTYGYTIPIPENLLNTAGYGLLQKDRTKEALEIFEKNIHLYPASANTYDSFAEALIKDGQLKKAKENLEKAVALAEKNDNPQLLQIFRENLKRVSATLGQ